MAFWPPKEVDFGDGNRILWLYDASGAKLRKTVYTNFEGNVYSETTDYFGGIVYTEKALDFFPTSEGRVDAEDNQGAVNYQYQYYLKDQLGNTRVSFADVNSDGALTSSEILQDLSYYPFGMRLAGAALNYNSGSDNKFLYNGKEFQEEHGLNWYHYGARYYDSQLGRWWAVDPVANLIPEWTPFNYTLNNPINMIDPDGRFAIFDDFLVGFVTGLVGGDGFSGAWDQGKEYAGNSVQLWSSFGRGGAGQIVSKLTWELPQQVVGVLGGHLNNMFGNIENITHDQGATLIETGAERWGGYTIGSIITAQRGTDITSDLYHHEYGHYIQSQILGPTYLFAIGLPSLGSAAINPANHHRFYTERWADHLAENKFGHYSLRKKP